MRGRQMKAAADRKIRPAQRPPWTSHARRGDASIRASVSEMPPERPQTTKTPTAISAKSLTTASTAMAMTTPWCRSFASRLRVPKITVKSARPMATMKAELALGADPAASEAAPLNTSNDTVTD